MADIWVKVLTPADTYDLVTLEELKTMLGLSLTDTAEDAQLQMWIDQYSDYIAQMCDRTFAYEKVAETWRGDTMPFDSPRLFLTHYPVLDADVELVESPNGSVLDPSLYDIENDSGKMRIDGAWNEPVTVTYSGGYVLPEDAPPALKAACGLLIQQARLQARGNLMNGVRSISHRESRVQFFDLAQMMTKGPMSVTGDSVNSLLSTYMRIYV